MKITIDKSYSWNNIIFDIIRLFTSQDVNFFKLKKLIVKVQIKYTTNITMIILIFFTIIITKSFTSLLLTTYFKLIKVPYVESLEQLIDGDESLIVCLNRTFLFLRQYKVFEDKQIDILREKKDKYEKIVKFDPNGNGALFGEGVFSDMIEGKIVILEATVSSNLYINIYKRERDQFVISEHKYVNQLVGHHINNKSFIKERQIFGFVFSIFSFSKICFN